MRREGLIQLFEVGPLKRSRHSSLAVGEAGLAMSEHLSKRGLSHLIVERHRIAECWRSERWDSLVASGPAWHDRFSNMTFAGIDPDSFASKHRSLPISKPTRSRSSAAASRSMLSARNPMARALWLKPRRA
jgi:hypothetical protein